MSMRSYIRPIAIFALCAVTAWASMTLAPSRAAADPLGGALGGALIGGLITGRGGGAIAGAVIGGVVGGIAREDRRHRRWQRRRAYVRGYRRGYRHGYDGPPGPYYGPARPPSAYEVAPHCREVGGYQRYMRRTGRVCRLD